MYYTFNYISQLTKYFIMNHEYLNICFYTQQPSCLQKRKVKEETPQRQFHKRIFLLPRRLQHPQACKKLHKSVRLAPSKNWAKINNTNKKTTLAD